MDDTILSLKDRYPGQTLYIVGRGPSLAYLKPSHFGSGPIITINQAIQVVQDFKLPNDLYSMQKDGCNGWNDGTYCMGRCEVTPPMSIPNDERIMVILQRPGYSYACLPDYPNKLYMTPTVHLEGVDFDSEMSTVLAVEIGRQIMKCAHVVLMCMDSFQGEFNSYGGQTEEQLSRNVGYYAYAIRRLQRIFADTNYPHTLFIPEAI